MSEFAFTKAERLSGERNIARLFDQGTGGFIWPFRYVLLTVPVGVEESVPESGGIGTTGSDGAMDARPDKAGDRAERDKMDARSGKVGDRAASGRTGDKTAGVSVLISVSKRNHKTAVARNLMKRRTREAYRLNKSELTCRAIEKQFRVSLGLIYASKDKVDFQTIEDAVRKIIAKVSRSL